MGKNKASLNLLLGLLMISGICSYSADKIRVGLFQENQRDVAIEEIKKTLIENGMVPAVFNRKDLNSGNIYQFDILYFGGGWGGYNWLDLQGRMHLVEFVETHGGGVIFSMFRCGCVTRSSVRPSFPEIAQGYNKSNGSVITIVDKTHQITQGLPEKFMTSFYDHATLKLGPNGKVLALDDNNDITMACGETGFGRVVFIGPWIGLDQDGKACYPMAANDAKLLLNSVSWASNTPFKKIKPQGKTQISDDVKLKVLRQERIWDWTHDERGFDRAPGILAAEMFEEDAFLDDLLCRVKKILPYSSGDKFKKIVNLEEKFYGLKEQLRMIYEEVKKRKTAEINVMSIIELEQKPEWKGRLLFPQQVDVYEKELSRLEKNIEPIMESVRKEKKEKERTADFKQVESLIKQLDSDDKKRVRSILLELGRIGDKNAIPSLIRVLKNNDYEICRNTIYALSWMKAEKATDPLIELAEATDDVRLKRRAVQALGMIGNLKSEDFLIKMLNDSDSHVRQNAIMSLGWLKSHNAVSKLIKIAESEDISREERACVIRAIGHIGEKQAKDCLLKVAETYREMLPVSGTIFYHNYLPIQILCEIASAEIDNGGRKDTGIRQHDFLREKNNFYWLTDKYNAMIGRFFYYGNPSHEQRIKLIRQAKQMGVTAVQSGDGISYIFYRKKTGGKANLQQYLEEMGLHEKYFPFFSELGLKYLPAWFRRGTSFNEKADYEYDLERIGHNSCIGGYWFEECVSWAHGKRDIVNKGYWDEKAFRSYLDNKYKAEELSAFGINDISMVKIPSMDDEGRKNKFLFAEYMEYVADRGVDEYREIAEWLKQFRMGTELLYNLGGRSRVGFGKSTYISGYPRVTAALSSNGPQSYSSHSSGNNFGLELHLDGESRPVNGQFYAHQSDCVGRVERGYASSLLHGQFFFQMAWYFCQKKPWDWMNCWEKGRAEAAERQFCKGKKIGEFLVKAESPKLIALLFSGRTSTLSYGRGSPDSIFNGRVCYRYTQNQQALWEALIQSHLPVDILWLETLSPEKLARYKVAILSDAKSLAAKEETLLQNWVNVGGVLISTGGTSLHDQWDRIMGNYGLAELFGVNYCKTEFGYEKDSCRYLERDLKPEKAVEKMTIIQKDYRKFMEGKDDVEYEKNIGCDSIKPTTGIPVAVWKDKTPAVIENHYGKGLSIFLTPVYPGLSHNTIAWTVDPLRLEFWNGMRELIVSCAKRGLEFTNTQRPLEVNNCPNYVEVALRLQDNMNRQMVHLLNYEYHPGKEIVKNVDIRLDITGKTVRNVYYPYPETVNLEYKVDGNKLNFKVRDFDVHEIIVLEYDNTER